MSASDWPRIAPHLESAGITIAAREQAQLLSYLDLLERWNRRINLVGDRDRDALLHRHLLDCLMLEALPRRAGPQRWVDLGSGAGLPAVVLAVLHPRDAFTAVERTARKATFLGHVAAELGLDNLNIYRGDAEQLAGSTAAGPPEARFDCVSARAFRPLSGLVDIAARLLKPGGELWAMKGRRWPVEAAELTSGQRALWEPEPGVWEYRLPKSGTVEVGTQFGSDEGRSAGSDPAQVASAQQGAARQHMGEGVLLVYQLRGEPTPPLRAGSTADSPRGA